MFLKFPVQCMQLPFSARSILALRRFYKLQIGCGYLCQVCDICLHLQSLFGYQTYSKVRKLVVGRDRNQCTDLRGQRRVKLGTIWCLLLALSALWMNMFWVILSQGITSIIYFCQLIGVALKTWGTMIICCTAVLSPSLASFFPLFERTKLSVFLKWHFSVILCWNRRYGSLILLFEEERVRY